jgi:hypothetical protein
MKMGKWDNAKGWISGDFGQWMNPRKLDDRGKMWQ